MDKDTKEKFDQLMKDYEFTDFEKKLVEYSQTSATPQINHSRVLSTLLLIKQLDKSTEQSIQSNHLLAKAGGKLTWALIGVGFIQALVMIVSLFIHR